MPNHTLQYLFTCCLGAFALMQACSNESATAGASGGGASSGAQPGSTSSGGRAGTTSSGGETGSTVKEACDVAHRSGRFSVESQTDFGVVQGKISDGVVPTSIPRLVSESGPCKILQRRNLVCSPACVGGTTCGEQGTCIDEPRPVSVGKVTITGLTQPTVMSPQSPGNSYFAPGADNPPFTVGGAVVLTADGAEGVAGFQLSGTGSSPLGSKPSWVLEKGKDLALEWPKNAGDFGTEVAVELSVDQHGLSPLSLSCEFEDTGKAVIPASVVDQLLDSGVSGFPNGRIFRRTAERVNTELGCVDFLVGSPLAASVSVAGSMPCKTTAECPSGQACNVTLERCE